MTAEEIIRLIEHPEELNGKSLAPLTLLLESYPYFQTAHLLYLLNLHAVKDSEFIPGLKVAASYAGDRRKLFLQVNEGQFDGLNISLLENQEEEVVLESPFALVDFFLSERNGRSKSREEAVSAEITDMKPVDLATTDYLSYFLSGEVAKKDSNAVPMQHQDVIDEFLRQDEIAPVRIVLNAHEYVDEEIVISDPEQDDANDFLSETLAKIYLKQKKYVKALEIIRKLNLLYPEKNIYFADQIRFLEKLITNTKKV